MNPNQLGHENPHCWIKLLSPISDTIKNNKSKYGVNKELGIWPMRN